MRKTILGAVLAVSTVATAMPAAAQWAPPPPPPAYGNPYGAPYGNAYGYDNYGQIRSLQARIDQVQRDIRRLDKRNRLSNREADRLNWEARQLEQRLRYAAANGLSQRERFNIERGIQRLQYRVAQEVRDGNRYAYNDRDQRHWGDQDRRWRDHDRDGRNDRWEDDRGHDHD